MKFIRSTLVVSLSVALLAYGQGNTFDKIRYNGGTVQTSVKPDDWGNHLAVTADLIRLQLKDGQAVDIDPRSVTGLSYGQEAHRRVGTFLALGILISPVALFGLFHKTRLHYIGIECKTPDGRPSGLLLQAHKNNYRAVLMALRGATGARVAVSEEDRKYVPTGVETVVSSSQSAEATQGVSQTAGPAATGSVQVTSTPPSAEVWVDGSFVGSTPAKLMLAPGKHKVRVTLSGYADWQRELQVIPGSEASLNAVLEKR